MKAMGATQKREALAKAQILPIFADLALNQAVRALEINSTRTRPRMLPVGITYLCDLACLSQMTSRIARSCGCWS